MEFLADIAGHPERCAPSIHIAGSKGKGSVTAMLAAILTAAGYKTARYMSPHVYDIRERISLDNSFFSEEIYCNSGGRLRQITEEILPSLKNLLFDHASPQGCEPTYWELLTLLFFLCAQEARCDAMVVETGMGGRLDSTNILNPLLSVITLIELEHTTFLGNTITMIATEKAGIIKEGKPLVLSHQCDEALAVFREKAKEKNSPLYYMPDMASNDLSVPIPGKVFKENAALAVTAAKIAFPVIMMTDDVIKKGLENLYIPGRFEKISDSPVIIIDGAHTPASLAITVETFCSLYGEDGILIFGCAADKDADTMAKIAYNHFKKIIITTPGTFKTAHPSNVFGSFIKQTFPQPLDKYGQSGEYQQSLIEQPEQEKVLLMPDTEKAVRYAVDLAKKEKLFILGTGSFYLISEIKKILDKINNL